MKNHLPILLVVALSGGWAIWMPPVGAQNAAPGDQTLALVQSIAGQQKLIEENQTNIDKSVLAIQEDLRQAKIYVSRSGRAASKP